MNYIRVEFVRWVDAEWPGWIEVHLREADGGTTAIIEKVPVLLADERATTDLEIPSQIHIPCDVLKREQGIAADASALVRLHFNIEGQRGRSIFRVSESDVINYQ